MRPLIDWVSLLAALGVLGGFGAMVVIVLHYEHLEPPMYLPFQISVLTFFGSLVLCFVMWALGAWYDRVQLRWERSIWQSRFKALARSMHHD